MSNLILKIEEPTPVWPPNYNAIFAQRQKNYLKINSDPSLIRGAIAYYENNPVDFIEDWGITYDPRNSTSGLPATLPFILFDRQKDLVKFILNCLDDQEGGLVEKTRDVGATWISVALSVWLWRFKTGSAIGWGSRKEQLVDRIGDPDSIFEKIRMFIEYLPRFLWPKDFNPKENMSYMKIINPENGSTVTGEAGDNIGRGGRKLIYFKDESAHYERPEKIEAALGDNTNCQIDISSVAGTGNIFNRRREAGEEWEPGKEIKPGVTRVFIFDWRDHPLKTQEWYDIRKAKYDREGLSHIFSQEVDRDYSAAVENILIPAIWVKAAIDAHVKLGFNADGEKIAALDVADEGGDLNALSIKNGNVLSYLNSWAKGDVGETTRKAVSIVNMKRVSELQYDCIGVGSGVKSESNRLIREGIIKKNRPKIVKWNAAAGPLYPNVNIIKGDKQSPQNKDFYANLKAQGGWNLRCRFEKTYEMVAKNIKHDISELISISSKITDLHKLVKELSQPTYTHDGKGRILVNKKPDGTKSPNLFDTVNIAFWPVKQSRVLI